MRICVSVMLAVVACGWLRPAPAAEEKLSIADACTLFRDGSAMADEKKRARVAAAFSGLADEEAAKAADALATLLPHTAGATRNLVGEIAKALGPGCVPALVAELPNDAAWDALSRCIQELGAGAVPPLLPALDDPNEKSRYRAAFLLTGLAPAAHRTEHTPALVAALSKRLADPLRSVQILAIQALGRLRGAGKATAPAIAELMPAADAGLKHVAVQALEQMGALETVSADTLRSIVADSAAPVLLRASAARALLNARAPHDVQTKAAKGDAPARKQIAQAAREPLPMLADENDATALQAATHIAALASAAIPAFAPALAQANPRLRRFAAFALARIGKQEDAAGRETAAALLADKDPLVRRNAVEAMGILGQSDDAKRLLPLLQDPDLVVQLAARRALDALAANDGAVREALSAFDKGREAANTSAAEPSPGTEGAADTYEIGGPLAGLKLPLSPTQHGEPAGYPGCIPELAQKAVQEQEAKIQAGDPKAKPYDETNAPFTTVGQQPERELYPNSVEHWRAYGMKYEPVRSLYDQQSQIKNFVAPDIPGATRAQITEFAEPVHWVPRWGEYEETGKTCKPVPVVRFAAGDAPFVLDLGTLAPSVYCVRVIAAVPTNELTFLRKTILTKLTVNDGLGGEPHAYVKRTPYTDNFYCVAEMFFHAPVARAYRAEISLAEGSEQALLVHNISVDDCLAGHTRRAIKTRMTLAANRALLPTLTEKRSHPEPLAKGGATCRLGEERALRDAWLWQSFPKDNAQADEHGSNGWPQDLVYGPPEDETAYGAWQLAGGSLAGVQNTPVDPDLFLENQSLGLAYTLQDFLANRPLPAPYPHPDYGPGFIWPDAEGKGGRYFAPIAARVTDFYKGTPRRAQKAADLWIRTGNDEHAHDAAVLLARWAWALPTLDQCTSYIQDGLRKTGYYGRLHRFYQRCTSVYGIYGWYAHHCEETEPLYDLLFPYISTSWELAASINRFVPWVKTPKDVIKLLDTDVLQEETQRLSRYHWHNEDARHTLLAAVAGDNEFTRPWMDFVFSRSFVYPLPLAGIDEVAVSGCCREGSEYIASAFYAGGENFIRKPETLERYIQAGGLPEYSMDDPVRYPKAPAACWFTVERRVAGLNSLRIGDVTGPDKYYGNSWDGSVKEGSVKGWRWTHDPRFAFMLKHFFPAERPPEEQKAIDAAAATVSRPVFLTQTSRAMPNWASILEAGVEHDDYRLRRALAIRVGLGWGHHHNDGLDLQIYAHGTMATCDAGQRPGYSQPADRSTRMHNLVEVDGYATGGEWFGHAWIPTLADTNGARYTLVKSYASPYQPQVTLRDRQCALIDVGDEPAPVRLPLEQCLPGKPLPAVEKTPDTYVFDVFRTRGGKRHTYSFQANLSDQVTDNAENPVGQDALPPKDKDYLAKMAGRITAGDAPDHFMATFRIHGKQIAGDLGKNAEAGADEYFTRLHILGEKGARVMQASLNCTKWKYLIPRVFVQHRGPQDDDKQATGALETAFAAIIEPYVKTPFIASVERPAIPENATGAPQAVALVVKTTGGQTDLCFADGEPGAQRTVGEATVAGEFCYLSRDGKGLRQATLARGTILRAADILLAPSRSEYQGRVTAADYRAKTMTLDGDWPTVNGTRTVFTLEVGMPEHMTAYTAAAVKPGGKGAQVDLLRGADFYLGSVLAIDEATNTVYCNLSAGIGHEGVGVTPGMVKSWVASNAEATKFWRADYLGGSRSAGKFGFKLDGPKATFADFGELKKFRLWEYGVGDTVCHATCVSLRRLADGTFAVQGDVDAKIGLKATTVQMSTDEGKTWTKLAGAAEAGLLVINLSAQDLLGERGVHLRVE